MSNPPLTISLDGLEDARHVDPLHAAIGSLPLTFRRTASADNADVVVIGGEHWMERMAAHTASGTRGIVLVDPWPIDDSSLQRATSWNGPVVIDSGWRHNPAVDQIREHLAELRRPGAVLEVSSTTTLGSDLRRVSVGLLDLITAVAADLVELQVVRDDDRHRVLSGRLSDHTIVMATIVATNAKPVCASLSLSGWDGRAQLVLPDPITAVMATATVTGPTGHSMLPAGSESAHRAALRRMAAAVAEGTPPDDLSRLAGYAPLLLEAVNHVPASPEAEQATRVRGAK